MLKILRFALLGLACSIPGVMFANSVPAGEFLGAVIASMTFGVLLPVCLWKIDGQRTNPFVGMVAISLLFGAPFIFFSWLPQYLLFKMILGFRPGTDGVVQIAQLFCSAVLSAMVVAGAFVVYHPVRTTPWDMAMEIGGSGIVVGVLVMLALHWATSFDAARATGINPFGFGLMTWQAGLGAILGSLQVIREHELPEPAATGTP